MKKSKRKPVYIGHDDESMDVTMRIPEWDTILMDTKEARMMASHLVKQADIVDRLRRKRTDGNS